MKRKYFVSLLIATMVSAAFASCGKSSSQESSEPAAETDTVQASSQEDPTESVSASEKETDDSDSKVSADHTESNVAADMSAPEEPDYSETYTAYLQILQENKDLIDAYTWQNESYVDDRLIYGTVYPVALADVYGDGAPELIFMRATGSSGEGTYYLANLVVCAYEDSTVKTLYDENLDVHVAGGTNFCIFTGKDRTLYRYDSIGDEGWTYNYSCLTETDGILSVTDKISQRTYPDENYEKWIDTYYQNDSEISKEEYETVKSSYYDNIDKILLCGDNDDEVLIPYAEEHGTEGMTYNEALQKLTDLSNGTTSSSSAESASSTNVAYADVYKSIADLSFYFSSGAGGWQTDFKVMDDGVIAGNYHDSEMGESGEGYPNGTVYTCDFMGRFEITEKIDEWTYRMVLEELTMDNLPGEEWIDDEIRYVASEAYGLADGKEFLLYMPGLPTSEMTEEGLGWYKIPRAINEEETPETLPCYGIYNVKTGEGFFSE